MPAWQVRAGVDADGECECLEYEDDLEHTARFVPQPSTAEGDRNDSNQPTAKENTMTFTQMIRFRTDDPEQIAKIRDRWEQASDGDRTAERMEIFRLNDEEGTYLQLVDFPSEEAARANSDLQATKKWAEEMQANVDGMEFTDMTLVDRTEL